MVGYVCFAVIIICFYNEALAQRPIRIVHNQTLYFGKTVLPTSGNVRVRVTRNGNLGGATTALMLNSNVARAEHRIRGSGGNNSIQIALSECSTNAALGLRIRRFRSRYDNSVNFNATSGSLPAPGFFGKMLWFGADLVIASFGQTGNLTPCYNIDVNYD